MSCLWRRESRTPCLVMQRARLAGVPCHVPPKGHRFEPRTPPHPRLEPFPQAAKVRLLEDKKGSLASSLLNLRQLDHEPGPPLPGPESIFTGPQFVQGHEAALDATEAKVFHQPGKECPLSDPGSKGSRITEQNPVFLLRQILQLGVTLVEQKAYRPG